MLWDSSALELSAADCFEAMLSSSHAELVHGTDVAVLHNAVSVEQ